MQTETSERSEARTGTQPRVGAKAMTLLAAPLNVRILKALGQGPAPLRTVRQDAGAPPLSTMRLYMRTLEEARLVERRPRREFPTSVDCAITPAGRGLLEVGGFVARWLDESPTGSVDLGTAAARNVIRPLVEAWSTSILRALAAKPLSLTQLDRLLPRVSYPSLERRLRTLRLVGLIQRRRGQGSATPYATTRWLRGAAAPLVASIAWERGFCPDTSPPIGRLDIETAFLLAAPVMELPREMTGKCRLVVEGEGTPVPNLAGVLVGVDKGTVVSCATKLDGAAESWVSGTPHAWLRRLYGRPRDRLEVGGNQALGEAILERLGCTSVELR